MAGDSHPQPYSRILVHTESFLLLHPSKTLISDKSEKNWVYQNPENYQLNFDSMETDDSSDTPNVSKKGKSKTSSKAKASVLKQSKLEFPPFSWFKFVFM